jgi:hypothetical protein
MKYKYSINIKNLNFLNLLINILSKAFVNGIIKPNINHSIIKLIIPPYNQFFSDAL